MEFRIADTFTDSLARLNGQEQKLVKTTAFDLQLNPAHPSMKLHKLDRAKDKSFWSIRVNRDIRLIVHRSAGSLLLCYVGHHDAAYRWAERRKLEVHPKTGAAQLVEIRETVREVERIQHQEPSDVQRRAITFSGPPLFAAQSDDDLLAYGVPPEWLEAVKGAHEDSLLELADHLPAEAAEALLELATGNTPAPPILAGAEADPFKHPDAQRRFRVVANAEELERALDAPWEKWTIFLHPEQRGLVERNFTGPARVSGSAGTGKTIVALHRAVHLARSNPDSRVLLTTFSEVLANALRQRLRRLISHEPAIGERLEVGAIEAVGHRLYEANFGRIELASPDRSRELLAAIPSSLEGRRFTPHFVWTEWTTLVDAWQIRSWEEYREVPRLGRKTRLSEGQREALWEVYEQLHARLDAEGLVTRAAMFTRLAEKLSAARQPPFDFAVVDEAQDMGVAELRFLAALGGDRSNGLFFAGDLGQRIFQLPFSWKALGVDIRGRSLTLRVNYRTSHQIRRQADQLLGPELADVDGNVEGRRGTISVFNGPAPVVKTAPSEEAECQDVAKQLAAWLEEGLEPHEVAVFVRSRAQEPRAVAAVEAARAAAHIMTDAMQTSRGKISVSPMHLAKGLEFRAVAVMACDDQILPLQERVEEIADEADLEDVYETERNLLYVACTRARDHLSVTGVEPASEFLEDLTA